jgi:hypothetical protein
MWPRLLFADWWVPLLAVTSHFSVLGTRINEILDVSTSKIIWSLYPTVCMMMKNSEWTPAKILWEQLMMLYIFWIPLLLDASPCISSMIMRSKDKSAEYQVTHITKTKRRFTSTNSAQKPCWLFFNSNGIIHKEFMLE